MNNNSEWYQFQEVICEYFNSIGASANTNVTIQGVRTSHDIDILVKTKFLGEDLTWVVEAKKWKSKVNKLQVFGLRTIVEDIGADRGFIISEVGYQKGAYEAAKCTNVKLKTFDELKQDTRELVESEILKTYRKRLRLLEKRYWSHSKKVRIKYGLRNEVYDWPITFSGNLFLNIAVKAIVDATKKKYPINLEQPYKEKTGEVVAENFQQLTNWLNLNLNHLDEKIMRAEVLMKKNDDFDPLIFFDDNDDIFSYTVIMEKAFLNDKTNDIKGR